MPLTKVQFGVPAADDPMIVQKSKQLVCAVLLSKSLFIKGFSAAQRVRTTGHLPGTKDFAFRVSGISEHCSGWV